MMRNIEGAVSEAARMGRSGLRSLASDFKDRVVGSAFASLRLSVTLLLTAVGILLAMVAAPVLLVVFAMTAGVSHGLRLDVPVVVAQAPPLQPGELACPVPGAVVTQPWGPSDLPGEPAMFGYGHFHTGIDLGAPLGTPILAAEPGQVLDAAAETDSLGMLVGYGNLVRIQAGSGRVDYYAHMTEFAVERGEVVQTGQVIGFVGSTGYSTGPHLHFEVRIGGMPVDPTPYLRAC